jgi:predicted dehydrogenase
MNALRAAIVGAGLMGRWHAAYARRAGARIAAIVDADPSAAVLLQRRHPSARMFGTLDECLSARTADVVHICTPSALHATLSASALRAGAHVVVEKPAADSPDVARELVELAAAAGRQLVAVHQFAFQRGFRRILQRLPELGDVVRVEFHACTAGADGRDPDGRRAVLREIVPHPAYLLRQLLGPAAVDAAEWRLLRSTDDDLDLVACTGATALSVSISRRSRPTLNELHVWGTRGAAVADLYHGYSIFGSVSAGRSGKAIRPFAAGLKLLAAAGGNLALRAAHREPAYPGLLEVLRRAYRSICTASPQPVPCEEIIAVAKMMQWLDAAAIGAGPAP